MKNQATKTPPKQTTKSSITNPKETETYELFDKVFRIILLQRSLLNYKNTKKDN